MNIASLPVLANEEKQIQPEIINWPESADQKPDTVPVIVKTIIDPLTFISREDKVYRLAGLDSPALSDMDAPQELTEKALAVLNELITDKELVVFMTQDESGRLNHMGHTLTQAKIRDTGEWIQGHLLANGYARVRTTPENTQLAREMYALEKHARDNKKGLWSYPQYNVLQAKDISGDTHGFQLIEGEVYSASLVRNAVYLNFAQDWKKDFSIGIEPSLRKNLSKENLSPQQWAHKKIRIRGPIRFYNGPFIDLTHKEQIEFIDEPADD